MRPPRAEALSQVYDDLDGLKIRVSRLAAAAELAPTGNQDGSLAARLDDLADHLSAALDVADELLGAQHPGERMNRNVPRLPALTLWPEFIPAFAFLDKRIENRGWWRPALRGQLVALHGGGQWGGRAGHTARPRAMDTVVRLAEQAGCTPAQIHAYQLATGGLVAGWENIPGHIKIVVRVDGAVRQSLCEPEPWMLGTTWAWRISHVHVLERAVPVANGWHRGIWRAPRHVAARVLEQLNDL